MPSGADHIRRTLSTPQNLKCSVFRSLDRMPIYREENELYRKVKDCTDRYKSKPQKGNRVNRHASINEMPIKESERLFFWPLGRRPDDHASLSDLGL